MLAALGRGDETGFAELYDTYASGLLRLALSLTGSHVVAEEAVQEVFVSLVRRGPAVAQIRGLKAYLYTAVRNSAWRERKRWAHRSLEAEELPISVQEPEPEYGANLEKALGALPEDQRQVILLKIDGDMTFEEIATALQISANTAASRYRYGMEKLKRWMT